MGLIRMMTLVLIRMMTLVLMIRMMTLVLIIVTLALLQMTMCRRRITTLAAKMDDFLHCVDAIMFFWRPAKRELDESISKWAKPEIRNLLS